MKTIITTSEGNVKFELIDGRVINIHPYRLYTVYNQDTVSFIQVSIPKEAGQAIVTSRVEDLEVNGSTYSDIQTLQEALLEAFVDAGAQARAEVVDQLPTSGRGNTIYLVPRETSEGTVYDEYIYIKDEQRWELLGDTSIEIDRYVTKETYSAYTGDTAIKIQFVSGAVDSLSGDVADFETATTAALSALNVSITNEVDRATSAETALSGAVDFVSGAVTSHTADTSIHFTTAVVQTQIDESVSGKPDIWYGTQAQYDTIDPKDSDTLYVISDATPINMSDYTLTSTTNAVSGVVSAHTANTDIHVTTGDKATWNAVTAKTDNTAFTAHTANTSIHFTTAVVATQIEQVTSSISADVQDLQTALSLKQDTLTAGVGIDITNDVISVTSSSITSAEVQTMIDESVSGKADASEVAENELVTAMALNDLNGKIASAASAGDLTSLSGVVTAHTANTQVHVTSADKSAWDGKASASDLQTLSGTVSSLVAEVAENELVTAMALNNLNSQLSGVETLLSEI